MGNRFEGRFFGRQKWREMFREKKGTDGIDLESRKRIQLFYLRGGLLGMKDARDAKRETEVAG